jgi:broad specificity phosphatase PhoE
MHFIAIRVGQTEWDAAGRIDPLTGMELTAKGLAETESQIAVADETSLSLILAGAGQAEQQAAAVAAKQIGIKRKTDARLGGLDYGLWQGLTIEEVRHRQPSLWKQWLETPLSVRPPGGETIDEIQQRLAECLAEMPKRYRKHAPLLVLKPIPFAVLECMLTGEGLEKIWEKTRADARVLHARFAEDTNEWLVTAFESHGDQPEETEEAPEGDIK